MKKINRILHIFAAMDRGGAETFIMNVYRKIDRTKFQFDFVVTTDKKCEYDDEIYSLGGNIYSLPNPSKGDYKKYKQGLIKVIQANGPYDAIHSHVHHFSGLILRIAQKENIPVRISHSHSTQDGHQTTFKRNLYRWFMRNLILKYSTNMLGCSEAASESLFGKKNMSNQRICTLYNGVDLEKYKDSKETRDEMKKNMHVPEDAFVIGHIGRFNEVKNHFKILDIFESIKRKNKDAYLVLVGDGPLRKEIEELAKERNLKSAIKFLGIRNDVSNILQAMDVFLMPSLYEGLPVALVEAQAAGLPCVVSDSVTLEANLNCVYFKFISLNASSEEWNNAINQAFEKGRASWNTRYEAISKKGYDIDKVVKKLEKIYG